MTPWTPAERRAWAWPASVLPSEWAEANRILPASVTSEPGPWRNARTPYLRGIMDAICEPGVEEVVVLKAVQVGASEAMRNMLGYWIDREPGPTLIVLPNQKKAEDWIEERVKPLLDFTPAVKRHVTSRAWDVKKGSIKLDSMQMFVGWAGSSATMTSRPIRYLLMDEVDEYPAFNGRDGSSPIDKALKRVTTYQAKGRSRVVMVSTPTDREGNICQAWESCSDQRTFWVPCPHCGAYQNLIWARIRYGEKRETESRKAHAARILDTDDAWYECERCQGKIVEGQKPSMLDRGAWVGSDQVVTPDGRVTGPEANRRRVGFRLPGMYSPYVRWARAASDWIEAQGNVGKLCTFINDYLAEPFADVGAKIEPGLIALKAKGAPAPMLVPGWTRSLIATADTQGVDEKSGYFWYTIRAWGYGYRSQLIDFGVARSKDDLKFRCLDRPILMEGGRHVQPTVLLVDSGGPRWNEIYLLAKTDTRIIPTKGSQGQRTWMAEPRPQKKYGVVFWLIDTEQAKDQLKSLMTDPDMSLWLPNAGIMDQAKPIDVAAAESEYCRQMASESKEFDRKAGRQVWKETIANMNHLWDCEALQCAAAWYFGCGIAEPPQPVQPPAAPPKPANPGNNYLPDLRIWKQR